jgi:hypothetical protein
MAPPTTRGNSSDQLVFDRAGDFGILRLELDRLGADLDGFGNLADLEFRVEPDGAFPPPPRFRPARTV